MSLGPGTLAPPTRRTRVAFGGGAVTCAVTRASTSAMPTVRARPSRDPGPPRQGGSPCSGIRRRARPDIQCLGVAARRVPGVCAPTRVLPAAGRQCQVRAHSRAGPGLPPCPTVCFSQCTHRARRVCGGSVGHGTPCGRLLPAVQRSGGEEWGPQPAKPSCPAGAAVIEAIPARGAVPHQFAVRVDPNSTLGADQRLTAGRCRRTATRAWRGTQTVGSLHGSGAVQSSVYADSSQAEHPAQPVQRLARRRRRDERTGRWITSGTLDVAAG